MSFYPNQSNVLNQFEQFNMVSLIMFDEVLSAGEGGMLHLSFLFQCDIISKLKHDYWVKLEFLISHSPSDGF